jgi:hypothetical protein
MPASATRRRCRRSAVELPDPASTPSPMSRGGGLGERRRKRPIAASAERRRLLGQSRLLLLAGLGLSLTPCVFPMIPILSGIIAGQGHKSRTRAASRCRWPTCWAWPSPTPPPASPPADRHAARGALQNAWVLGGFALVFVVLSFSMFGFYELQLPTFAAKQAVRRSRPPAGRARHRRLPDGRAVGADRRPLRRRAAGRRAALHRPDRRCRARRHGAVRHGARHGRAADRRRRRRRLAAAQNRAVDGRRQEGLRRAAAGHRRLAGFAGDPGRGADAGLGGC